ncbi:MAG: antitoxin [Deltaproteobacteria bacterium]|nr:antitoxin [Deltaproteobacteria bacterium]
MRPFDKEEHDLMESIEKEEWISVNNFDQEIKKAREAARATFKKSERMNIRMSPKDLEDLKVRALQEGMPYQTLVSSVIHKYLSGRLMEKEG